MQVHCTKCNAVILPADLDIARSLAKCADCGEVFNCADQLALVADFEPSRGDGTGPDIPMPKGIRVFHHAHGLRIVRRWFGPKFLFLIVFCAFWDGFMLFWFSIAIAQKQWAMAAFGTIHGLVGVGLTYYLIAGLVNSTTITVLNGLVKIVHGPIRVPGNREIKADALRQLYTKRIVHHSKNGTSTSYELRAMTADERDEKLLGGLEKQEQGLYIEQEIEKFLGITDRPIRGEVER